MKIDVLKAKILSLSILMKLEPNVIEMDKRFMNEFKLK